MRKLLFLFVSALLLVFVSCENFMNGSDVQEQLEKMIDVANAKSFTIVISNDTTMGSFLSSGDKECKVGQSINVQFNVKKDLYIYKGLKAVSKSNPENSLDDYVDFVKTDSDNARGVYKTSIKLLKESDDILIVPDCVELPAIVTGECKPDNTRDWDQDSTVQIVFNKPVTATEFFVPVFTDTSGQNLAEYFEEPYFSADSTVLLIPTNKQTRLLDPNGTVSSKDIIVTIDLSNIVDEDGNAGIGSIQHKYRIGKTFDSVIPVLNDITVFSTSDENSNYYKELTKTDFASWATDTAENNFGDFGKNLVSKSVYIEFEGSDEGSGISGAQVKETHFKYTDGSAANLVTGSFFVPARKNEVTGKYCLNYEMNTPGDGIILLEIFAEDYAENISATSKSVYVVKDTSIDSGIIKFKNENDTVTVTNNNLPDPNNQETESYEDVIKKVDNLYTDNADGTQTITLSFRDTTVDTFYSECSSPFELEVLWSYDSNDENSYTTAAKTGNVYSIKRDSTKIVFLKINCKDTVGNERIVSKIIPPALEIQLSYNDGNYYYEPANMTSYAAMCIDQLNQQNSGSGAKFLLNYDFSTLNNAGNYEKQNYAYIPNMTSSITINFDQLLSDYKQWYANKNPALHLDGDNLLAAIQPKGNFSAIVIADFGNFPGPRSINTVEASITSWKYFNEQNYPTSQEAFRSSFPETDSNGGKILDGPKSKGSDSYWNEGYTDSAQAAFAMYGKALCLSNEIASDNSNDVSQYDLVFGFSTANKIIPINEKIKIEVTPIKNVGVYKIHLDDYINKDYPGYEKVTYYFYVDVIRVFGQGDSANIACEESYPQRESTMFLSIDDPEQCKYTVRIEAYDDAKKKYYIPVLQMANLEGINPECQGPYAENPRNAFRSIIRESNLPAGEGITGADASNEDLDAYFNSLKAQNALLSYMENYCKVKDYKTFTFEGRVKEFEASSDTYQHYNGFKDLSGKVILSTCDFDVAAPFIRPLDNTNPLPIREGSYLIIESPSDANPKYIDSNETKAELSYYIIPSQSNDYKLSSVYSQEELETNFAKYKQTLIYYPNEGTTTIPFGNTKPGMNVVYIVAEDAYGNSALAYYPVVTTSYGKLPVQKKQIQFEETVSYVVYSSNPETGEPSQYTQTNTYNYTGWEVTLDFRKRSDLLVAGKLPEDLCVELQYINENIYGDTTTYYWRSPESFDYISSVNFIDSVEYENSEYQGSDDPRSYKVLETDNPLVFKTVIKFQQPNYGMISSNNSRWGRIRAYLKNEGQNLAVKEKGHLYYDYLYLGEFNSNCSTKNCIEGLNGYLVYSDKPVLAHTMFSKEKLTSSIYDEDASLIWENEAADTGIQLINNTEYNPDSPTVMTGYYNNDNLKVIPKDYYYTTVFHFADGTTIMSDIKQKQ